MKNLVICCAGDMSLHSNWAEKRTRCFDLFLIYYGDKNEKWNDQADYYMQKKGTKWPLVHSAIKKYKNEIDAYDSIWIPDDDILTDSEHIQILFDIFSEKKLALAQPALNRKSYISHRITRKRRFRMLRYTNFVEIMAPIFSKDALALCYPTFLENHSGWGLDYYWPQIIKSALGGKKIAIIDKIAITHTRPVNSPKWFQEKYGVSPIDEMQVLLKKYKLKGK